MKKIIALIFLIILVILQVSFVPVFDYPINRTKLILILVIFFLTTGNYQKALASAVVAGLLLDLFSAFNFGIISLSLLLTTVLVQYLFNLLFAKKSFYAVFSMGFLGTFLYNLALLLFVFTFGLLGENAIRLNLDKNFILSIFYQSVLHIFFLFILFWASENLTRRLKSIFLLIK